MKVLLISDIHSDYNAAISAYCVSKPDFVLDCGDHHEIKNLFEFTPHFYIHGNHEPSKIFTPEDDLPLPNKLFTGQIIILRKNNLEVSITGLDGNYTDPFNEYAVNDFELSRLSKIKQGELDILLAHESPLLVDSESKYYQLSREVIEEIDRIKPKYVFSGHTNHYSSIYTPDKISNVVLDDMSKGYCVLNISDEKIFNLERIICRFR